MKRPEFYFDADAADRAAGFFDGFLRHSKGEWAGRPFRLLQWQREKVIRPLFGWKRADGMRRYRRAYIEIPRKNGKSTLASGIALYLLFADGEPGAEVYSAAADRDQAAICFEQARAMVEASPALSSRANLYKRAIVVQATRSSYKVLSADAYTKHGLNASGIVFDELHAQPNRELFDVLVTSTGARRQPMMVMITTAGFDRTSICWEQHEYARQVLADPTIDPSFFAFLAAADEADDWREPTTWAKANPSLGQTISLDYLAEECNRAIQSPAYQNTFRRLHLNQWTSQDERWLDMAAWDACALPLPDLTGRVCYAGLDLASTTDIAALCLAFPPVEEDEPHWVLPLMFVPSDGLVGKGLRDRVPYDAWVRDGHLVATPGNVIDFGRIRATINELGKRYDIQEITFDRWGATQISQALQDDGFEMVEFGQGFASMSAPTRELMRLVLAGQIGHGGHPVLRWMADNLVVESDAAGNLKPNKRKSRQKIDGMVALIMALARATVHGADSGRSVYDERGLVRV
jgi:phage terminase large subunit-like protein